MIRDTVISGVHIGQHSFEPDDIIKEIKDRCINQGMNMVTIRPPSKKYIPQEYYIKWAKFLFENEIYFSFVYAIQHAPKGMDCHLTKETVSEIKKIAGKYFLGDILGETGSSFACKFEGYYNSGDGSFKDDYVPETDIPDMETAHKKYIEFLNSYISVAKKMDMPHIVSVEATALNKYTLEAGTDISILELMCGNPEMLVSFTRGGARAYDLKLWGTYVAHEWYGGMRHDDILKRKRLELAYKYAYLSGSQIFCLESGDEAIGSYGQRHNKDSVLCSEYQKVISDFASFIKSDERPIGGPKAKVAFVQGNHDAWGGWGGSSLWNQFKRNEWGHGEAEHSWKLLEEIGAKRVWSDIANFGDNDLSALPAYGMYDVIPSEASKEFMCRYDYLIFVGWNSMTDEIYDKLLYYVSNGGKLLMTAAHLNYNTKRDSELILLDNEKLEKLFGCRYNGNIISSNGGVKFEYEAKSGLMYPGAKDKTCDPIYSSGYVSYIDCDVTTGVKTGVLSETFLNENEILPSVIENRVGKGCAILVTSINYPGNPSLYPLYRAIVREIITQSYRECEIKITSNGALRYSVYEGNKIYLLNTDYDFPINVNIQTPQKTLDTVLAPLELKTIQI